MHPPLSLKSVERKVFQTTFADGLWDVLIGCFLLEFALAPLLSESLGDFWSSAVFLPFWGLVYLAIRLVRKHVVEPRIGTVSFGKARQRKLRKFTLLMLGINAAVFILGILAVLLLDKIPGGIFVTAMGLFGLSGFSIAAYLLDYPRLYFYGLLFFLAPLAGEWLYANHGISHHGFPIAFGFAAGIMILTGLATFGLLLRNNPVPDGEYRNG